MKKLAKSVVASILGYQVRQLYKKNNFKVIGVAGSIGKTSTKLAIAHVLSAGLKVQYQQGNYNDLVSVPLIFFGEELPSLYNPLAWLAVFWRNAKLLKKPYPFEVVVVELGSDAPGQINGFKRYLKLEIAVVTAISPEHMMTFGSLDDVAKEELAVSGFSSLILANKDLCDSRYLDTIPQLLTYGINKASDYGLDTAGDAAVGRSEAEQYSLVAAAGVAQKLGIDLARIKKGLASFKPFAGRMQELKGINGSKIIDDSYNSSPAAAKLALDYLYSQKSPQKIAVLGSMNEMGGYSRQAHEEVGDYCNPKELSLVATIGAEAEKYLAPAAEAKGCDVKTFVSPYEAGDYIKGALKKGAVILVKGSQNGVFAEEAIKRLLANPDDAGKLVRQERQWLEIKRKAFKS